ncbi:hypothetical protein RM550_34060 [Streptomyces sp. DSM 41527]|uniref:Uncharacterized protein n=1 Tax=Streptomyces mooreae TaxID=3075523 RepID=A0ABU2TIC0_9ACTN|nr:hypothetical protein [Streptomyces sp. DSM 41527]MDT0460693.1 hypothetical protein [Streptomyces sp. DSM 41527]
MSDTVIREYVKALLRRDLAAEQDRQERIRSLEESGHRIVNGGQTSSGSDDVQTWEITDWRTGELIVNGTGGYTAYDEATQRLDPDGKWVHIDQVGEAGPDVEAVGIPASLGDALQDWVGTSSTSDEDVATFVGWSVEEVARHREEA